MKPTEPQQTAKTSLGDKLLGKLRGAEGPADVHRGGAGAATWWRLRTSPRRTCNAGERCTVSLKRLNGTTSK